jgi:hypothetical protein
MIKGLQGGSGLMVTGGNTALPYVGPNIQNPMTGMLRVHGTDMEVFNGSNWQMLSTSYATVGLDQDTQNLLQWAKSKQRQEIELLELATKNQAVLTALENLKAAQEQLTVIAHLARETYETSS